MNDLNHSAEVYKQALEYLRRGFSVIPVGKDKKPMFVWEKYQNQKPTEEELAGWFFDMKPAGIAILTGQLSNLVVLDVEVDGDISGLEIPVTPTVKTGGGGQHFYFKHPGREVKNKVRVRGRKIDIRGDGGYIIAPPSLHASGNKYEWLVDLSTPLAEMPEWMNTQLPKPKDTPVPQNLTQSKGWDEITYGVEEGRRHDSATRIAGKLLAHIPPKDRESVALPLLEAWNKGNTPPLGDEELHKVYDDIRDRQEKGEVKNPVKTGRRKLLSVLDILSYEPETYPFLIDPLLPHRGITALSGHPGAGKSWVMMEMARSIAGGTPLFGKFPTIQGNVLIVDEEGGMDEMHKRVKMLSYSEDLPIFFHVLCSFKLDNENDLDHLLSIVKAKEISLIIFDPYVSMHNKSENSAEETAKVMESLQRFNEIGVAVLFIHHLRKDSIASFGYAQALRGSSALLGRLDSLIVVKKISSDDVSDELQILHEKARRGKKIKMFQFSLIEKEGKMVIENLLDVEPAKRKIEQAKETTLAIFGTDAEIARKDIIALVKKETGIGEKNIAECIRDLTKEKLLVEFQQGKEKHYRLASKEQGQ